MATTTPTMMNQHPNEQLPPPPPPPPPRPQEQQRPRQASPTFSTNATVVDPLFVPSKRAREILQSMKHKREAFYASIQDTANDGARPRLKKPPRFQSSSKSDVITKKLNESIREKKARKERLSRITSGSTISSSSSTADLKIRIITRSPISHATTSTSENSSLHSSPDNSFCDSDQLSQTSLPRLPDLKITVPYLGEIEEAEVESDTSGRDTSFISNLSTEQLLLTSHELLQDENDTLEEEVPRPPLAPPPPPPPPPPRPTAITAAAPPPVKTAVGPPTIVRCTSKAPCPPGDDVEQVSHPLRSRLSTGVVIPRPTTPTSPSVRAAASLMEAKSPRRATTTTTTTTTSTAALLGRIRATAFQETSTTVVSPSRTMEVQQQQQSPPSSVLLLSPSPSEEDLVQVTQSESSKTVDESTDLDISDASSYSGTTESDTSGWISHEEESGSRLSLFQLASDEDDSLTERSNMYPRIPKQVQRPQQEQAPPPQQQQPQSPVKRVQPPAESAPVPEEQPEEKSLEEPLLPYPSVLCLPSSISIKNTPPKIPKKSRHKVSFQLDPPALDPRTSKETRGNFGQGGLWSIAKATGLKRQVLNRPKRPVPRSPDYIQYASEHWCGTTGGMLDLATKSGLVLVDIAPVCKLRLPRINGKKRWKLKARGGHYHMSVWTQLASKFVTPTVKDNSNNHHHQQQHKQQSGKNNLNQKFVSSGAKGSFHFLSRETRRC